MHTYRPHNLTQIAQSLYDARRAKGLRHFVVGHSLEVSYLKALRLKSLTLKGKHHAIARRRGSTQVISTSPSCK